MSSHTYGLHIKISGSNWSALGIILYSDFKNTLGVLTERGRGKVANNRLSSQSVLGPGRDVPFPQKKKKNPKKYLEMQRFYYNMYISFTFVPIKYIIPYIFNLLSC